MHGLQNETVNISDKLGTQLATLDCLTREQFDRAATLIDATLQEAMDSLAASAATIRLLLAAQEPATTESEAALAAHALRSDLAALLANSSHLSRLAAMTQEGFRKSRETCEKRTEREIARVVDAVARHRISVQENATALTTIALDRARTTTHGESAGDDDRRSA